MVGVFSKHKLLAIPLVILFSIAIGLGFQQIVHAESADKIKNLAAGWLTMQYHRHEGPGVTAATQDQANNYYLVPDKESGDWDPFSAGCTGGNGQLRSAIGHLATSADDGHIQIGGPNGGVRGGGNQDCLENRKSNFSSVATNLGFADGSAFYTAIGYNLQTDGSGLLKGSVDEGKLSILFTANKDKFWGDLPRGNLSAGVAPPFIQYAILADALERCGTKDGVFNNPATSNGSDSLWLYDAGKNEVGQYLVKANDDSKEITVGRGVGIGESGGKLSCGKIKQALMDKGRAEAYKEALGVVDANEQLGGELAAPGSGAGTDEDGDPTCLVDGVGWLICPVSNFLAKINDQSFKVVQNLMRYDVLVTRGDNGAGFTNIYNQWANMRNIANAIFIIALLVVIYSQMTGTGLNSYSIKRMVPRLIAAVILINASFWICALAVDFSNVLGKGLYDLLSGMAADPNNVQGSSGQWEVVMSSILAGGVVAGVGIGAGVAVAGAGVSYALLSFALPLVLGVLLALIIAIVTLIARQAIITILIIVAPIAFALYLLPNTSKWFDKWKGLFVTMLIMYPIIGVVFGGSALASAAVRSTAPTDVTTQLAALGIAGLPLALAAIIGKISGGLLGNVMGMANNKSKGLIDKTNNAGKSALDRKAKLSAAKGLRSDRFQGIADKIGKPGTRRRGIAEGLMGGKYMRSASKQQADQAADASFNNTASGALNRRLQDEKYGERLTGGNSNVAKAFRLQAERKIDEETKLELEATIRPGDIDAMSSRLTQAMIAGNESEIRMLSDMLLGSGAAGFNELHKAVDNADNATQYSDSSGKPITVNTTALKDHIIQSHGDMKQKDNSVMEWALDRGTPSNPGAARRLSEHLGDASTFTKLTAEEVVSQKGAAKDNAIRSASQTTKDTIKNSETLMGKLGDTHQGSL